MCDPSSKSTATSATARKSRSPASASTSNREAFKGGDNHAPTSSRAKRKDSPLIHFITTDDEDELMPPKGKLSSAEIETLTAWINEGAVWPDGVDLAKLEDRRDHWSFKPLLTGDNKENGDQKMVRQKASLPSLSPVQIDAFIDTKLAEKGLQRSPEADPISWLRRVTFDLTGLPPTPEEVAEFLKNKDHAAAVERLLASPRYGERWAQHWLDVVRYADTHGFEVNTERPNAWPYRDYVIRAFNNDTPYDRFIKEQLVGDAMGQDAATGFLVTASVLLPGQIGKDDQSKRLARQDSIDEIVVNIGQTFLGLSIGCARCHDHKFDPITAKDYYAMQAFVAGVEYGDRDLRTPEAEAARAEAKRLQPRLAQIDKELARFVPLVKSGAERPMINARENADRFAPMKAKRVRFTIKATNNLEPCIDELEVFNTSGENVALATAGTLRKSGGDIGVAERHELRFINDGRYGNGRSWMAAEKGKGWVELEFTQEQTIERVVWGRDREGKFTDRLAIDYQIEIGDSAGQWHTVADASDRQKFDPKNKKLVKPNLSGLSPDETKRAKPLIQEKANIEAKIKAAENAQKVFAGTFRTPDDIHLLNRGDPEQPKEPVMPAVLSALGDLKLPKESAEQQRRQALADWIASPQNPLTARVMVNRIWQGHFGTGLVPTPSDFGHLGVKPSHPELLDWLAAEFIRSGWSVKHMHRLIVLSKTYRQSSSTGDNEANKDQKSDSPLSSLSPVQIDSDVRYLWRFPSTVSKPNPSATRCSPSAASSISRCMAAATTLRPTRRPQRLRPHRDLHARQPAPHDLRAQSPPRARDCLRCLRLPRRRPKHRHPPRQHHADPSPQPLQQPLHPRPGRCLRITREKGSWRRHRQTNHPRLPTRPQPRTHTRRTRRNPAHRPPARHRHALPRVVQLERVSFCPVAWLSSPRFFAIHTG
jgi:hypothetical protein